MTDGKTFTVRCFLFAVLSSLIIFINQKFIVMKTLELNQMENIQGGFSVNGCLRTAGTSELVLGWKAALVAGWWGVGAVAIVGCAIGGFSN